MTDELGNNRWGAWLGALAGVACGVLATVLYYLYVELTDPHPYNVLLIFHAPVFMALGGMAGLLVWAMRDSGTAERGLTPAMRRRGAARGRERGSLPDKKRGPGRWRGPAIGAACGAVVALLYWLYFESSRPNAYSRLFALTYGPALVIFGAVAGLVFGATRDTD